MQSHRYGYSTRSRLYLLLPKSGQNNWLLLYNDHSEMPHKLKHLADPRLQPLHAPVERLAFEGVVELVELGLQPAGHVDRVLGEGDESVGELVERLGPARVGQLGHPRGKVVRHGPHAATTRAGSPATAPGAPRPDDRKAVTARAGVSRQAVIRVPWHAVAGYSDDLRLAHVLADGADDITTRRFRALDLSVETKPDLTPVSDADRSVEEQIRGTLKRARPRDAVLGEEYGRTGYGNRCWIIDPIDATKNFVRGVPVWATLIALMENDEVVVGVVSAPALNRRWWAARGGGAWTGRSLTRATRMAVSAVGEMSDASLSFSSLSGWARAGSPQVEMLLIRQRGGKLKRKRI